MSLRLRQMNFGRDKAEMDRCFVAKYNQLKAQSAAFMKTASKQGELDNYLNWINIRLQESVFENAKFTKRLMFEMTNVKDIEQAGTSAPKWLKIVRDTFSVHIVLCFFTSRR